MKNKARSKNDLNKKNDLNELKQFIHKNKKQNQILEKILKKLNQSMKNDEQDK